MADEVRYGRPPIGLVEALSFDAHGAVRELAARLLDEAGGHVSDPLSRAKTLSEIAQVATELCGDEVRECRRHRSWREVGLALNLSRQLATHRWGDK